MTVTLSEASEPWDRHGERLDGGGDGGGGRSPEVDGTAGGDSRVVGGAVSVAVVSEATGNTGLNGASGRKVGGAQ